MLDELHDSAGKCFEGLRDAEAAKLLTQRCPKHATAASPSTSTHLPQSHTTWHPAGCGQWGSRSRSHCRPAPVTRQQRQSMLAASDPYPGNHTSCAGTLSLWLRLLRTVRIAMLSWCQQSLVGHTKPTGPVICSAQNFGLTCLSAPLLPSSPFRNLLQHFLHLTH